MNFLKTSPCRALVLALGLLGIAADAAVTIPSDKTVAPTTYASGKTVNELALNTVSTSGAVTVSSGATVTFMAGSRIVLKDGFRAQSGSKFRARNGDLVGDADNDGMSNGWELLCGLDPNNAADALTDIDGDGWTNVAEYNRNTNPELGDPFVADASNLPAPTSDLIGTGPVVGSTVGSLSVGKTGEASYSIPLWVVPGTSGMEPKLSLNYSSQGGPGIAGYGWSVGGVSMITRGPPSRLVDNKVGPVTFSSDDAFYMDGQRLVVVSGSNGGAESEYRTQMESFTKVVAHGQTGTGPAWFEAKTKSGLTIVFGDTSVGNSRVVDEPQGGSSRGVWSWAVTKITDPAGNYMTFAYEWMAGAHEQRIKEIAYTGNTKTGLTPYAKVKFVYDAAQRTDWRRSFNAGMRFETFSRLSSVECWGPAGAAATKRYVLGYKSQAISGFALLEKLTEYDAGGKSYNPLTFEYNEQGSADLAYEALPTGFLLPSHISRNADISDMGTGFVDLNADGWTDFVVNRYNDAGQFAYKGVWLGSPTGWQPSVNWSLPWRLNRDNHGDQGARFIDVNGDGLVDFLWGYSSGNSYESGRGCFLNTGSGWNLDWTQYERWIPPVDFANSDGDPQGVQLADVNGDGLVDMVVSREATRGVYLNTPNGWDRTFRNTANNWLVPTAFIDGPNDQGARLVDLNGDGRADIIQSRMNSDGTGWQNAPRAWLNNGSGWTEAPQFAPVVPLCRKNYPLYGTEISDVNGDGLPDILCYHWNGDPAQEIKQTWLNTGAGWYREGTDYDVPYALACARSTTNTAVHRAGSAMIDLNQDGLPDEIVNRHEDAAGDVRTLRMLGPHGFVTAPAPGLICSQYFLTYDGRKGIGGQFVDLDADGAPDFVWNHYIAYDNNLPAGYSASGAYRNKSVRPNLLKAVTNGLGVRAEVVYTHLTKRDNNGDFVVYQDDRVGSAPSTTNRTGIGPMTVVQALRHQTGTGENYDITYRYGTLRSHPIHGSLGFGLVSVTDSRTSISQDTTYSQTYPFVGMPLSSVTRKGSLKLSESTVTYAAKRFNGGKTVLPFAFLTDERTYDPANGTSILTNTNTANDPGDIRSDHKSHNLNTTAGTWRYASATTEADHDETVTGTWFDDYGNVKQLEVEHYTGAGALLSSVVTKNLYTDTPASWRLGRLTSSEVTHTRHDLAANNPGRVVTRTSSFEYNATTGMLETETVEPGKGAALTVKTTRTRDDYGNVTTVKTTTTDPITSAAVERSATTQYDTRGRFPLWTKNALSQSETYSYDQNLGLKLSLTGPNNLTTKWEYDAFGRIAKETQPDNSYTETIHAWTGGSAQSKYLIHTQARSAAGVIIAPPARTYFDNFGRARTAVGLNGDGNLVYVETDFDNQGRAYRTSQPHFLNGTVYWAETKFDSFGRPSEARAPIDDPAGGTAVLNSLTTYVYDGLHSYTVVKAPEQASSYQKTRRKDSWTNALGQTVTVVDNFDKGATSTEYGKITYSHDAIGNVVATTVYKQDGSSYTTSFVYDLRGRKTGMGDPNMGVWSYEYDALGQLRRQTDNKAQSVTMTYDALGRMLTRTRPETVPTSRTVTTEWTYYTTGAGSIGKLAKLATYSGAPDAVTADYYRELYTYDNLGRPTAVKRIIYDESSGTDLDVDSPANTRAYSFGFTYDSVGRINKTTYPFGYQTQQLYSPLGMVKEIRRTDGMSVGSDGTHTDTAGIYNRILWQAAKDMFGRTIDEYGRALAAKLGNGIDLVWERPTAGGGVRKIQATLGGQVVRRFDYAYDGFQNVRTRTDRLRDLAGTEQLQEETFNYDALQRLTSWQITGQSAKTAAYDSLGNIVDKSGIGSYKYESTFSVAGIAYTRPNAVSLTGGTRIFKYDDNGNCTDDGLRQIKWTAANQVQRIDRTGGQYAEFFFDAADQRVRQKSNSGTTIYVGGLFERFVATGNTAVEHRFYVVTPTGRAVLHTEDGSAANGKDQYFVGDALGSISSVYDHLGRHVETRRYDPWGVQTKVISSAAGMGVTPTTRGFTDHEMLDGVGLIHMNGRVYDPVLGRFLSADPFVDDATTAGAYNRYAYCGNDPLGHTDPSGFFSLKSALIIVAVVVLSVVTAGAALAGAAAFATVGTTAAGAAVSGFSACLGAMAAGSLTLTGAVIAGAAGGFAASFAGSLLNGGSLGDSFRAGILGGIAGGITGGLAHGIGGFLKANAGELGWGGEMAVAAAAHGVVGGVAAEIQGGEFRHGFVSSAAAAGFSHSPLGRTLMGGGESRLDVARRTAVAATIGGTASELAGGKFVNGAVTSAFQHLFNEEQKPPTPIEYSETYTMTVTSDQIKDALSDELISRIKDWMTLGVSGLVEKLEELARQYDDIGKNPTAPFVKNRTSVQSVRLPKGWRLQGEVRGKLVLGGNNFDQETLRKMVNNEKAVIMFQFKRYVHNVFGTIAQRDSMTVEEIYNANKSELPYSAPMTEEYRTCDAFHDR